MTVAERASTSLSILPATPDRWNDLQSLFGPNGACGGCWCMWWRQTRAEFDLQKGEANRLSLQALVAGDQSPGLLAYDGGRAVGWCAVAPREQFPALGRSRILKPVDETPVWSVVCFYIARDHRRRGLSLALLRGAVEYVRAEGGRVVEGYPVEPRRDSVPAAFVYTGLASAFRRAGFVEVARRSETRPIMRYDLTAALPPDPESDARASSSRQ